MDFQIFFSTKWSCTPTKRQSRQSYNVLVLFFLTVKVQCIVKTELWQYPPLSIKSRARAGGEVCDSQPIRNHQRHQSQLQQGSHDHTWPHMIGMAADGEQLIRQLHANFSDVTFTEFIMRAAAITRFILNLWMSETLKKNNKYKKYYNIFPKTVNRNTANYTVNKKIL